MMYPYITLPDETLITHSQLLNENGNKTVEIHFERPTEGGFDMARCSLPTYKWVIRDGYTDDEIKQFEELIENHAHLFYKYAECGGIQIA